MKKLYIMVLLILPALFIYAGATLHYSQGPYWISYNSDPEYLYLFNSLALTDLKQTGTTGNPGTTLQILGAAILKITYALDSSERDGLESAVLKNPEFYLTAMNIVLVALNAMLLLILGIAAFNLTKNIWLGLLMQLSPFFSNAILTNGLTRISTEPLLLSAGLLFVLILLKMAFSEGLSKSVKCYTIPLALLCGFGAATKLTFFPLLIIPFFVLPKTRDKIIFLFLTVLSFVVWTLPVISQYKILLNWYYKIFTHTGYYGFGSPGIMDWNLYTQNIIIMLQRSPLFFLIMISSAGFILLKGRPSVTGGKTAKINPWRDTLFRILSAATVAQIITVLIVAKHFTDRYLLPVMMLSGLMLFLIFIYLRRLDYSDRMNKIIVVCAGIFFITGGMWRIYDIRNIMMQNVQIREEALAVNQLLDNKYKDYLKIHIYRCSSPVCALAFGNYYVNGGLYSESLYKIYGNAYFFNGLNSGENGFFHTWTKAFPLEDILNDHADRIVLNGSPVRYLGDTIASKTGLTLHLKDIFEGDYETIYAVGSYEMINEIRHRTPSRVLETTDFDFSTHPRRQ